MLNSDVEEQQVLTSATQETGDRQIIVDKEEILRIFLSIWNSRSKQIGITNGYHICYPVLNK